MTPQSSRGAALLFALAFAPACSVTALAERERTTAANDCTSDDECGGGTCSGGTCVASSPGELDFLSFELVLSGQAGSIAGKSLWRSPTLLTGPVQDLRFSGAATVTGRIEVAVTPECLDVPFVGLWRGGPILVAEDGSVPARLTFVRSDAYGVGQENITAAVDTEAKEIRGDVMNQPETTRFTLGIPVGFYDVYVEPTPVHGSVSPELRALCTLPPQLLLNQPIASSSDVSLVLGIPRAASIEIDLRFPNDTNQPPELNTFAGWQLDMIDSHSGRLISTQVTIPSAAESGTRWPLRYLPVTISGDRTPNTSGSELVRLSPPEGSVAPTFLFERSALELFQKGSAVITPIDSMPTGVSFEGQVLTRGSGEPVQAAVALTATRITKVPTGVFASYSRTAQTDRDGRFTVPLLPGTYRVQVEPTLAEGQVGGGFALAESEIDIPASPQNQAGRVVEVDPVLDVQGRAILWTTEGALGASVGVEPSVLRSKPDALERSLGEAGLSPRSARTSIDQASGEFAFSTDVGTFDFFVRPPADTNLAWYVMTGLEVRDATDVGSVELPLPVRLEGNVTLGASIGSEPPFLAQSLLRAYVLLDVAGAPTRDAAKAHAAVPVAETRVDALGHYVLNVPASLNPATKR